MRPLAIHAIAVDPVDPAAAQAGAVRAEHVHLDVVADVQHLVGRALQALARGMEDAGVRLGRAVFARSEEHTSELQSLMRISYAVFCLKKKQKCQRRYERKT